MLAEEREALMLRAAHMYYYEDLTQAAIADRLGTTRWTVSRLLERARESGMVTIAINHPHARQYNLEQELESRFGLINAVVVTTQQTLQMTERLVAAMAAEFITGLRPRPHSLAVAWGQTLAMVARSMPHLWAEDVQIYQTYGGLVRSNDDAVADSIGLMAKRARGVGHMIPAPAVLEDPDLAQRLMHEPTIARTLYNATQADLLLFSPGVPSEESVLVRSGFITKDTINELKDLHAVTDLLGHFVDANGNLVSPSLDKRTVAIPLSSVKETKMPVAIAAGLHKSAPLAVSLEHGFAKGVITDSQTALSVLGRQ